MAIRQVREYLSRWNREGDILEMDVSTATVELAAAALGVEPARIAKTISLQRDEGVMLLVSAGDVRIDNRKFKDRFGNKPRMLSGEETLRHTGHAVGGVCPFALPAGVPVYLDASLRRFETVYPACGAANSAIRLTLPELEEYAVTREWVDVCKGWEP